MLWQSFKQRLGMTEFSGLQFDLSAHFTNPVDLSFLIENFSRTEIDQVVRSLPSYKAPGPDGFNTDFLKKCWCIISEDFYRLFEDSYNSQIC